MLPEFSFPTVMYGIKILLCAFVCGFTLTLMKPYEVALSVSLDDGAGSLFLFIGNTCTRDLFVHKPDLQLVQTKNVADQQVIGSVVAASRCGSGRLAGCPNDEFVGLHQTEQLNGNVFTAPRRAGNARSFGNIVRHGDGNSAEGLNAFGQRVDKLSLFAVVLVEKKMELVERGTRDLPVVLFVHVAQGHRVGENRIEEIGRASCRGR